MTKEEFRNKLATVGSYALSARDLLTATVGDHFELSLSGVQGEEPHKNSYEWMDRHYTSAFAAIYGALLLIEIAHEVSDGLWSEAGDLIPDEEEKS